MPNPRRPRWTIGSAMAVIAGFALIFAVGTYSPPAGAAFVIWPLIWAGWSDGVARMTGGSRLRAGFWLCAAYPWIALAISIGLLLWGGLAFVEPNALGGQVSSVLGWGLVLALVGQFTLGVLEMLRIMGRDAPDQGSQLVDLVVVPLASWFVAFWAAATLAMALPRD